MNISCRSLIWITYTTLLSQKRRIGKETISSLSQANPVMPANEHVSNLEMTNLRTSWETSEEICQLELNL